MVFLFPNGQYFKEKQGRSLYDRIPRARKVWTTAEEITGQHIVGFSFGTPTEEMKPGPIASVAALAHMVASCETLKGSRITPDHMAGFGLGLIAAAVVGGVLPLETAFEWAFAQKCGEDSMDSPATPVRSPDPPYDFMVSPDELREAIKGHWPHETADHEPVLLGLLRLWEQNKITQVIVPGGGLAQVTELKKLYPGMQTVVASDLEDIGIILRIMR